MSRPARLTGWAIGIIIIIAVGIWYIYRSIAGFIKFNDNKPINAMGWM